MHKFETELKSYKNRVKEFDTHLQNVIRQKDESHEGNELLRKLWAKLVYHDGKYKPDRVNAIVASHRLAELAVIGSQVISLPLDEQSPLVVIVADAPFRRGDNLIVPLVKSLVAAEVSAVVVPVFNPSFGEPHTNAVSFRYPVTPR